MRAALIVAVAGSGACELQEITLAEPAADVVVAEALVQLGIPQPGGTSGDRISVLLHRTVDEPVPGALVQVVGPGGRALRLREMLSVDPCVSSTPLDGTGTCYHVGADFGGEMPQLGFRSGDTLRLEVRLEDGGVLTGTSVVPGRFDLRGPFNGEACVLLPDRPYTLTWTRSEGAWAYIAETELYGLRAALAERGIDVEVDPLFLLGLAVSANDTTIVFPSEFGVFDRFDLDRDVAVALQGGMPPGTWAEIVVTAVDRNYVNWVRGGNFNPSGTVRVPSVRGDGTGYFGTSISRWMEALVDPPPVGGAYAARRCPASG